MTTLGRDSSEEQPGRMRDRIAEGAPRYEAPRTDREPDDDPEPEPTVRCSGCRQFLMVLYAEQGNTACVACHIRNGTEPVGVIEDVDL